MLKIQFLNPAIFEGAGNPKYLILPVDQVTPGQRCSGTVYLEIGHQCETIVTELDVIRDFTDSLDLQNKHGKTDNYEQSV